MKKPRKRVKSACISLDTLAHFIPSGIMEAVSFKMQRNESQIVMTTPVGWMTHSVTDNARMNRSLARIVSHEVLRGEIAFFISGTVITKLNARNISRVWNKLTPGNKKYNYTPAEYPTDKGYIDKVEFEPEPECEKMFRDGQGERAAKKGKRGQGGKFLIPVEHDSVRIKVRDNFYQQY